MSFEAAWLRYDKRSETDITEKLKTIVCTDTTKECEIAQSAVEEIQKAFLGMFGRTLEVMTREPSSGERAIILEIKSCENDDCTLSKKEAYKIEDKSGDIFITGSDCSGLLYGVFEFIRRIATGADLRGIVIKKAPDMPYRMLNHWDNMDGSIERGYSGKSFFFKDDNILIDDRTYMYARLASSVGINAVVINNVNVSRAATYLITDRYFDKVRELSGIFAKYGIKLFMSLNYAAPLELGELDTADPLDEAVCTWWKQKMAEVFAEIPNLGGFLVKADSEGRPGPFTYGRTHADGANMLADAAAPFGGTIIWRCFVYNCHQDWRDYTTDRARSGYDNFKGLDGDFRDNVILQVKNGPMDFQVREPVHPLFGAMKKTNQMIEFQIAQEYTGQQRHVCYLIPMFKEILDFRTYATAEADTVKDIVSGRTFGSTACGMTTVVNTGDDENWTGHDLAAANFYGYGRLAFDTSLSAEDIASEWIKQTFGDDETVMATIMGILMKSWPTYENYNAPLGIGWMVNPHEHYGPNVDGYEYDRWGTYHRADNKGIGVDRTHTGTGYTAQYNEPWSSIYDDIKTCPEELVLFFHHVPYDYRLSTGKSVLQHIYDTHFEGVEMVEQMVSAFGSLEGKIDKKRYTRMLERFEKQLESAREWRDQINTYFYRKTGVGDEKGRRIY